MLSQDWLDRTILKRIDTGLFNWSMVQTVDSHRFKIWGCHLGVSMTSCPGGVEYSAPSSRNEERDKCSLTCQILTKNLPNARLCSGLWDYDNDATSSPGICFMEIEER